MVLIGNKRDLPRGVNQEQVKNWAESRNVTYYSALAMQGTNVLEPFIELIGLNVNKMKEADEMQEATK